MLQLDQRMMGWVAMHDRAYLAVTASASLIVPSAVFDRSTDRCNLVNEVSSVGNVGQTDRRIGTRSCDAPLTLVGYPFTFVRELSVDECGSVSLRLPPA